MERRLFTMVLATAGFTLGGIAPALAKKAPAGGRKTSPAVCAPNPNFVVYDNLNCGQPDTAPLGMLACRCFDERDLHLPRISPGGREVTAAFYAGKLPNKEAFLNMVRKHAAKCPGPIVMDFEHIPLTGNGEIVRARFALFITMAKWAKEAAPDRMVGYWGEGGTRILPEKSSDEFLREQRQLAGAVDAFFPNLYVWGGKEDKEAWHNKLRETMTAAHRLAPGKPVYPYIWPILGGAPPGQKIMSGEFWRYQLEAVRSSGAAGVVLWGFSRNRKDFDINLPWWRETVKFMEGMPNWRDANGAGAPATRPAKAAAGKTATQTSPVLGPVP